MKYTNIFDTSTNEHDYYMSILNSDEYDYEIPDISLGDFYKHNFPLLSYIKNSKDLIYRSKYVSLTLDYNGWSPNSIYTRYYNYGSNISIYYYQTQPTASILPFHFDVITVTQDGVDVTDKYYTLEQNVSPPQALIQYKYHKHSVNIPRLTGNVVITRALGDSGLIQTQN